MIKKGEKSFPTDIIDRHFTGELSPNEMNKLKEWIHSSSKNRLFFEIIESNIANSKKVDSNIDVDLAFDKFEQKCKTSTKVYTIWWMAAASLCFIVGMFFATHYWYSIPQKIVVKSNSEPKTVILPDQSKVILNAFTRLEYNEKFNHKQRKLILDGEAFFDVKSNKGLPLIIRTPYGRTEVIGTAFNLRSYKDQHTEHLSVKEGIVRYTGIYNNEPQSTTELVADESIAFHHKKNLLFPESATTISLPYARIFEYNKASLQTIISQLQDAYKVNIVLEHDTLKNCRFTGTFNNQEILEVLEVLVTTLDMAYHFENNVYEITGKGCQL